MNDTVLNFVKEIYPEACKLTGNSPIFDTAQAGLESGWGVKRVGKFNLFGMKVPKGWDGEKVLIRTREVHSSGVIKYPRIYSTTLRPDGKYVYDCEDWFVDFDSIQDCLTHHNKLLHSPQFAHALPFINDPVKYVTEIQAGKYKYATDTNYVATMTLIIQMVKKAIIILKLN